MVKLKVNVKTEDEKKMCRGISDLHYSKHIISCKGNDIKSLLILAITFDGMRRKSDEKKVQQPKNLSLVFASSSFTTIAWVV